MDPTGLEQLPASSRTWIYGAHRPPDGSEAAHLIGHTRRFLRDWTAHDRALRAGFDWRHHRFLIVAVDESRAAASGCSIDALVRHVSEMESELELPLVDTAPVWLRDPDRDGRIRTVSREEFRRLAEEGRVDASTTVFDLTVDRLGDLREGAWELPAGECWHASLLPDADTSPAGRGA